jgi:hypothetical protein
VLTGVIAVNVRKILGTQWSFAGLLPTISAYTVKFTGGIRHTGCLGILITVENVTGEVTLKDFSSGSPVWNKIAWMERV